MHEYLIRPKAPLLFRNAKPFASGEGSAETLSFPSPATLSGALRTAWAEQQAWEYNSDNVAKLTAKGVRGPLLVGESPAGQQRVLFPAPRDSLALRVRAATGQGEETRIFRIAPEALSSAEEGCDLPHDDLLPLHLNSTDNSKPARDAPAFWGLEAISAWLESPDSNNLAASTLGAPALPIEYRTHVAVDGQTLTAKDAQLLETAGLDFSPRRHAEKGGWPGEEYALLACFQGEMGADFRTIGGESRLGAIAPAPGLWPQCPDSLRAALVGARGLRLYLATPAIFKKGWLPDFIDMNSLEGQLHGFNLKLRAAAVPRWEAGTSWDMTQSKGGKGMRSARRMVAAGAVYWFEMRDGQCPAALADLWLTSLSGERAQDGFGLVLPGVWQGPGLV